MSPANVDTYVGKESAWHRLGKVIGKWFTIEEAFAAAELDFTVAKKPIYMHRDYEIERGYEEIPGAYEIYRTDNMAHLGIVGEQYNPIQHVEGFKLVDSIVGSVDGAHYVTAGSLGRGETVWGQADLNLSTYIKGTDDITKQYFLFFTGHVGNYGFHGCNVSERVVCENTLRMAIAGMQSAFRIRHMPNAEVAIKEAQDILQKWNRNVVTFEKLMNHLAEKMMTKEATANLFESLFPVKEAEDGKKEASTRTANVIKDIMNLYEWNDDNAFPQIRGTAYNMLNAMTEYADYQRSVRAAGRDRGVAIAESALFGSGNDFKTKALSLLVSAAKDLPSKPNSVVTREVIA